VPVVELFAGKVVVGKAVKTSEVRLGKIMDAACVVVGIELLACGTRVENPVEEIVIGTVKVRFP
jgi:hypothetical protein